MNFSALNLHPTVAAALAKRGYETATPVQAAVLHPDAAGRDLLVSSQTGSGKTIAFGAALAENLLAPEAARAGAQRANPLALVIVPTRELAVQVREELGWLLRETKLRLASFTGGTAVTGDLRALQKGLDVAIGTPGRLVDLLRRQRLELADLRVVVLDEADEMLDLGFREDLQTLLQAAPEARRTLLLSATLPAEIQALARRFQRDALRIDPRKDDGGAGARGAHDDITYRAHLIAGADRLAVVVNILRAAGDGRAIVFCTTREGVSRLHAALLARGFSAAAISGDRAQAERDRALEQVRKGDARVLVATNVAARGLHLPDVDLIIHADLPLNAESLTHRSGRTGRAGRKGTAVVIASLTERRKAERLLMSAHVPVVWTAPPSPASITAAARERVIEELLQAAAREDGPPEDPAAAEMVTRLEGQLPAAELARRLLLREFGRLPVGERVHDVAVPGPERRDRFAPAAGPSADDRGGRRPGRADFAREGAMFRVNIGAKDNADPRWLLPLICRRGGVTSRDVGAIRVGPQETVFEISGDLARDFELSAAERDPRAPHVIFAPVRAGAASVAPGGRPGTQAAGAAAPPRKSVPGAKRPSPAPPAPVAEKHHDTPADQPAPSRQAASPATAREPATTATTAAAPSVAAAPSPPPQPRPPAPAPIARVSSAAPRPAAPAPQPASIFQTRAPVSAPVPRDLAERGGRSAAAAPVIEVKRAPRVGPAARPAPAPDSVPEAPAPNMHDRSPRPSPRTEAGANRNRNTNTNANANANANGNGNGRSIGDRRTDGNSPVKRAFKPHPPTGSAPFSPPGGPTRTFGGPPPRPPGHARPAPASPGRYPDKGPRPATGAGRPIAARPPGRSERSGHAGASSRPAAGPGRPPFWKEGARKRPGPAARDADERGRKDTPPRR